MSSLHTRSLGRKLRRVTFRSPVTLPQVPLPLRRLVLLGMLLILAMFASCASSPAAPPKARTSAVNHPAASVTVAPHHAFVGGGFADAGLTGEYFANKKLSGNPAFVRQDVRLDFDWGAHSPGGSISEPYKSFPADNFSVRWEGQILPRFSETYTFAATADDGIRIYIKDPSHSSWTTVINQWPSKAKKVSSTVGKFKFAADKAYDIRVEYRDLTGPAIARLEWSSPSTPREVIAPTSGLAINYYNEGFADAMMLARDEWDKPGHKGSAKRDTNGWPMEDAMCMVWEGAANRQGTYLLQFKGIADLDTEFGFGKFSNQKYDADTNTTTATMTITDKGVENFSLIFKNTYRDARSGRNTGVTDIKLMPPTAIGALHSYPLTTLFLTPYKDVHRRFTAIRFMHGTNWNNSVEWADRTRTNYSTQHHVRPGEDGWSMNGIAWEYRVALCNEIGKDLYINIPQTASDDYITKIAQLIRYGSDGNNPYTKAQTNPVFPPLNSNLKVYVEYSNEVWNAGFEAWHQNFAATQAAVKNNTPESKILMYDGVTDANTLWNRRHALQTVQASNLFRNVFSDDAMGTRVRILLEWQYDNIGWPATTETQLTFLNDYFNNGDGKPHVATPHPVSYYLWGGGGAAYFNGQNEGGVTTLLSNGGFEAPSANDNAAAPTVTAWNFSGTAGIAHNNGSLGSADAQQKDAKQANTQVTYLQGSGSMSIAVPFPASQTSNIYSLMFKAVQQKKPGAAKTDAQTFDLYFDNTKINKPNTWQGYYQPGQDWGTYYTDTFSAKPGSTHTIRFVGGSSDAEDTAFINGVTVTSVNAIFATEVPSADYQQRLEVSVNWAKVYGLNFVAYEGGWAIGGDAGSSPLQNWAKFNDPRTKQAQLRSIEAFYKAGGDIYTFGTYSQWDTWENANKEPLVQGIDESNRELPPDPTNGVAVPGALTQNNKVTAWGDKNIDVGNEGKLGPRTLMNWNILVPATGTYTVNVNTGNGGEVLLAIDDAFKVASGKSGGKIFGNVMLTKGLHTVRLKAAGGSFSVTSVSIGTTS